MMRELGTAIASYAVYFITYEWRQEMFVPAAVTADVVHVHATAILPPDVLAASQPNTTV
jgi:hypothetical protein